MQAIIAQLTGFIHKLLFVQMLDKFGVVVLLINEDLAILAFALKDLGRRLTPNVDIELVRLPSKNKWTCGTSQSQENSCMVRLLT